VAQGKRYELRPDRKGMAWDLLLYVPTVAALATTGVLLWYQDNKQLAYLLSFLASFFFLVGANRVLKGRLLLLPSSPVAVELLAGGIRIVRRDRSNVDLMLEVKVFRDLGGRSFGLSGRDGSGARQQFVVHKAQFAREADFEDAIVAIGRLAPKS
jgi:hypothetical protein